MKVSKLKSIFLTLGVLVLMITIKVDAASLSIQKSSNSSDSEVIFEVYLDASDGEVSNKTLKIASNASGVETTIKAADNASTICDNNQSVCSLSGTYNSKIKVCEVTLKNSSENNIDAASISASIEGIGNVTSDEVTLKGIVLKTKSKSADLSNITVSVGSLSPTFSTGTRSYTVDGIKDTVNSITISTTCENCVTKYTCLENCSISENKNNRIMLENGANSIELVVTSEDGSNTNTYNFVVYRGEIEEPSAYLKDLKIDGVEFDTKFDMLLNDYTAKVDLDVDKLDIKYELEDPKAIVKITGNDNLKEGENIVTITVTSSDGASKQVYTITVTKEDLCDPENEECDEEKLEEVTVVKKKSNKVLIIVIIVVVGLSICGVSGYFIFRKKKTGKKDKNNKNDKNSKLKKVFIEEEQEDNKEENDETKEISKNEETKENEIIQPRIKPTVDEALEDLMKTKEIELNNL